MQFYQQLPKADQSQVQLVLIGKGQQKEILDIKIAEYRLPKDLILSIDWMDREALINYYRASQVFFYPSHEDILTIISRIKDLSKNHFLIPCRVLCYYVSTLYSRFFTLKINYTLIFRLRATTGQVSSATLFRTTCASSCNATDGHT